MKPTYKHWRL